MREAMLLVLLTTVSLSFPMAQTNMKSVPPKNEIVMPPGMTITAVTSAGAMKITAVDHLTRSYTWEGATRSVEMIPRGKRWYGSMGLYFPGPGDHWDVHNGITRGVLEEGQQHFKSQKEALDWIRARNWIPCVYRDDGLFVGWGKTLPRRQLNVEVWQFFVDGKKPTRLPGSHNDKITVAHVQIPQPPLVQAVLSNDLKTVKELLEKGSDPNAHDSVGSPVLVIAAKQDSPEIVSALLAKGAKPDATSSDGSTALLDAVTKGRIALVKLLLSKGANVNSATTKGSEKGMTPLIAAAVMGQSAIVDVLIQKGANVNAVSESGLTALKFAEIGNHEAIVKSLKKAGAKE